MIDTSKYEGHTEGPWRIVCWERQWYIEGDYEEGQEDCTASDVCHLYGTAQRKDPTARLIADAPLLLAEVERLRERLSMWESWFNQGADNKMQDGDVWDIVFHNHECPNGKDCDGGCWNCETKELIE